MAESRLQKSKRNMAHGLLFQAVYLVLNFVTRILIIRYMGMDTLALNGLFTEVLSVLNLAEMGVGTAITYSLYKPLAENDTDKISAIVQLFKKMYYGIAAFVFIAGVSLIPFLPKLITNINIDFSYLVLIYMLFLIESSVSYCFSYKLILLIADQKGYIQSKHAIINRVVFFFINLPVLVILRNYTLYLTIEIVRSLTFYILLSREAEKIYHFKDMKKVKLPKEEEKSIFRSIRQMFVGKLSNKVLNSTDNILISSLISTTVVGVYGQYSMFINGFLRLFSQVNESITGSIGNLIAVENKEKSYSVLRNVTYLFFVSASVCACCLLSGINPFLAFVVGKEYFLEMPVLMVVVSNMFFEILKMPLWTFFYTTGMFKDDQYISMAGCILNLIVSIVLTKKIGLAGIFVGTFLSLLLMYVLKLYVLYDKEYSEIEDVSWLNGLLDSIIYFALYFAELFIVSKVIVNINLFGNVLDVFTRVILAFMTVLLFSVVPFIKTSRFEYVLYFAERRK